MKRTEWVVSGKQEDHKIVLNRGMNPRDAMSLVLDGKKIAELTIPSSSVFAKLEYSFVCEDENLLLIVFGNKSDLVFRNELQSRKKKFKTNNKVPVWAIIGLIIVNFLPAILTSGKIISWAVGISSALLGAVWSIDPLYSKGEKIIRNFLILMLNLAINISCWYLGM